MPPKLSRAEARTQTMKAIMDAGRSQLATDGAAALSLRSVAREVGIVSSAVYRYLDSRDDLLTRLIIDAYNSLGDAVDEAILTSAKEAPADRWVNAGQAVRSWAAANPHEYALVFGSPVPGYAAPADTVIPGTRVPFALVTIVQDAYLAGDLVVTPREDTVASTSQLHEDLKLLRGVVDFAGDTDIVLDVLNAWTQMFGLVSFEIFMQTRDVVSENESLFEAATRRMAHHIGLR